jgi:hypothetical protein
VAKRRPVDGLVAVFLVALAMVPLAPVFGWRTLVVPAAVGLVLGAAIAGLAAWRRWPAVVVAGGGAIGYLVVGGALIVPHLTVFRVVPTWASIRWLSISVTTVWARLVTVETPVGPGDGLTNAPFIMALAGSAVAVWLATRLPARLAPLAVLAPVVVGAASVVLGARHSLLVVPLALVFALTALVWAGYRSGTWHPGRVVALAMSLVLMAGAGYGGYVAADARDRLVVRDQIEPPFNPQNYISPLSSYRRYVKELKDQPLVVAQNLPDGALIRLAVMDAYDGTVWNVAGGDQATSASGEFRRMANGRDATTQGDTAQVTVTASGTPGQVWLYSVGDPTSVSFDGDDGTDLREQVRLNTATGAMALTGGLPEQATYTVDAVVVTRPTDDDIAAAAAVAPSGPVPVGVPDVMKARASELARDVMGEAGGAQALALEKALTAEGYFSHGQVGAGQGTEPAPAGHGADRMYQMLTDEMMVGDAEQYASLMALLARQLGLDVRVVMGFDPTRRASVAAEGDGAVADGAAVAEGDAAAADGAPSGEIVFTGEDMLAWVEINLQGLGWVPFFPTPPQDRTPDAAKMQEEQKQNSQVVPPPPQEAKPSQPPDADLEAGTKLDAKEVEPPEEPVVRGPWLYVSLGSGLLVLALFLAMFLVVVAKNRRSRRRERSGPPARRVVAGWDELIDRMSDLGEPVLVNGTRLETAALADPAARGAVLMLARQADEAAFSNGYIDESQAKQSWHWLRQADAALRHRRTAWQRLKAKLTRRSLKQRKRRAKAARKAAKAAAKAAAKRAAKA